MAATRKGPPQEQRHRKVPLLLDQRYRKVPLVAVRPPLAQELPRGPWQEAVAGPLVTRSGRPGWAQACAEWARGQ